MILLHFNYLSIPLVSMVGAVAMSHDVEDTHSRPCSDFGGLGAVGHVVDQDGGKRVGSTFGAAGGCGVQR